MAISERLKEEQVLVERAIREAFAGVTRDGGVSWSQADALDGYECLETVAEAAKRDTETRWEDLIDDSKWIDEPGTGGFNFLDAIGYRYYLPPAMVRCARRGWGEFISYAMQVDGELRRNQISLLTAMQSSAAARFVRFMIATHAAENDEIYGSNWESAYKLHWKNVDPGDLASYVHAAS